ncbi:MAG TPA: hypothetical protein PKI61_03770 [bacterium]|nr:hypothetical protein [bacterium]HPT29367.1 hypothetical protein [bacterium]
MNDSKREQSDSKNRQRMTLGIILVMGVILVVWILNFNNFINPGQRAKQATSSPDNLTWAELKQKFDATMSQIGGKLNTADKDKIPTTTPTTTNQQLQDLMNTLSAGSTTASTTASSSDIEAAAIKSRLEDLENKLERNNP